MNSKSTHALNLITIAERIRQASANANRFLVAIAGPPAAGKSTLTAQLAELLSQHNSVAVVAMDGFHLDNQILLDNKGMLQRKGAPETFDTVGFRHLLTQLRDQTAPLAVPEFDRELDLSRACAKLVEPTDQIILIEGNYLLVDQQPWQIPKASFDFRILIKPQLELLRERLIQRWLAHDHTLEQAIERAESNDLINVQYVLDHSIAADLTLE